MDSLRWLWTPSDVTMAHVTVFYTIIVSRFICEWTALLCSLPA